MADRPVTTPSIYARFTLETKTGASVAIKYSAGGIFENGL
jgi:hypothetical protein